MTEIVSPTIPLQIDIAHAPTVNFALQQNHVPVVRSLGIKNLGSTTFNDLHVRVASEPPFFKPWEGRIARIPAGGSHSLTQIDIVPDAEFLMSLSEAISGTLTISVGQADETLGHHMSGIELLAHDEWSGLDRALPDIVAAFVLPNHPEVQAILTDAATLLGEQTQDSSLSGYQTKDKRRVIQMTAAIYSVIQSRSINYCNPPASFGQSGQKIRLPDSVMSHRLATCLDLSLLVAACLEQAGLHPLIVFTQGHAFVGVWLIEECFADAATDEPLRLRKRIDLGEILVFESTLLTSAVPVTFQQAIGQGRGKLDDLESFQAVIDVIRCRKNRIRPIPTRATAQSSLLVSPEGSVAPSPTSLTDGGIIPGTETVNRPEPESPATRLDRWKRKLLDLTLHNRLINFKDSKKTLPLMCPDLGALEDALAEGDRFTLAPKPSELGMDDPRDAGLHLQRTGEEALKQILLSEFAERRLRAALTKDELDRRTLEIFRTARTGLEEGGANALFLAVGFLAWYESNTSEQRRLAPIILLPVELERNSVQEGFRVRQTDEEPRINVTLLELLAKDYDLRVSGLDPLPQDANGLNVAAILNVIRQAIKNIDRWDVLEQAHIGLFSFSKFLMWRDLDARTDELVANKVVNHLINRAHEPFDFEGSFPDADRVDYDFKPETTYCPLPSDSSQLAAVYSAAQGRSFVLYGPPGTGKSQTITNLIAHCLATGKSVLFVSEKMAALNVVHHRLTKVGLAPFCLELHSNKSHKMRVIEQLGQALDRVTNRSPEDWSREAQRLATLRQQLNDYARALHQPHASGESIFRGIAQLIGLRDVTPIDWNWTPIVNMTRDRLDTLRDTVERVMATGSACGHPKGHVWSGVGCTQLGPVQQREIEGALTRLEQCLSAVDSLAHSAGTALGIGHTERLATLDFVVRFARLLLVSPQPPAGMLNSMDWAATGAAVAKWRGLADQRDALEAQLFGRYREDVLKLDLMALRQSFTAAQGRWFLPRWWQTRAVWKQLASCAKEKIKIDRSAVGDDLAKACSLADLQRDLANVQQPAGQVLAHYWCDGRPDWNVVSSLQEWCGKFRKFVATAAGSDPARLESVRKRWVRLITEGADSLRPDGAIGKACTALLRAYAQFAEAQKAAETKLQLETPPGWASSTGELSLHSMRDRLAAWKSNLKALRPWCLWQATRKAALELGLAPLVRAYEEDGLPTEQLQRTFDRSYYQAWVEQIIDQDPVLRSFSSTEHERRIQQFRDIDKRFMELSTLEIQARLAGRQPHAAEQVNQNSEMGVLRHQLQRRRGHMPVRSLFQKIPNLLPRLKPCLLMSPNSVAQYLDPGFPKFDLVVFDEASQIPAWDAVGAIARGTEVVIVGDPKQLPPTNFFTRGEGETAEDDDLVEDLESILDDCIAAQLPQMELRWHYRSRHESLIAFSNHHYYDNHLLTFPSPHLDQGVSLHFVTNSHYDRGKSCTNPGEADALVAEVVRRLRHPELSKRSIGIVTFSMAQQTLVEDKLDEIRRSHPDLEPFFGDAVPEPVFVKNLENVQGDERDTILFSICYGPDAAGRVSLNFGPLNRDGGERRLNVAITRARHEVLVFSTLRADQIDLSRSRARGVQDLRCFLDYAERGQVALAEALDFQHGIDFESPFEKQVCEALRQRGHHVHTQVGCSGYRIDLAVVDPNAAGRYVLGIECDGANYHSAKSARDRDKLRAAILADLGWRLHRVWSTDWWTAPETELAKIESAIANALASRLAPIQVLPAVSTPTESDTPETPAQLRAISQPEERKPVPSAVYSPFLVNSVLGNGETFYSDRSDRAIRQVIEQVVEQEGPISLDLLGRRVLAHWGLARRTETAMDRVEAVARTAAVQVVDRNSGAFVWPTAVDPLRYDAFRINGETDDAQREASDIAPEEVAAAARHVLRAQVSLPHDDLVREVARLFGFQRLGQGVAAHMAMGIRLLVESGMAIERNGSVALNLMGAAD